MPTNIRHDNTLSKPLASYVPKDRVDAIITNPPFGGMEEDGIETNFPQKFRTRETADLFLGLPQNLWVMSVELSSTQARQKWAYRIC